LFLQGGGGGGGEGKKDYSHSARKRHKFGGFFLRGVSKRKGRFTREGEATDHEESGGKGVFLPAKRGSRKKGRQRRVSFAGSRKEGLKWRKPRVELERGEDTNSRTCQPTLPRGSCSEKKGGAIHKGRQAASSCRQLCRGASRRGSKKRGKGALHPYVLSKKWARLRR